MAHCYGNGQAQNKIAPNSPTERFQILQVDLKKKTSIMPR